MPQVLAWMRLLARIQRGELQPEVLSVGNNTSHVKAASQFATSVEYRVQAPALIFIDVVPLTSALICTCADDGPATQTGTSAIPLHGPCFDRPYAPLQASSLLCGSTVLCLHP